MGFSTSFCPHIPPSYACIDHYFKLCSIRVIGRRNTLPFVTTNTRFCSHGINSILGTTNFSINSNEAPEPARALLERLFMQTQKLEEQMNGNSHLDLDAKSSFDLEILESDLHAALEALRQKEEDLLEAEKRVKLENTELNLAREELEQREKRIDTARSKQEKLEEELRHANLKVVSQARHLEDLKLRLNQRDQEIAMAKYEVSSKEEEIYEMKCALTQTNDGAAKAEAELESKSRVLNEVHEVVRKQEHELQALRNALQEKQLKLDDLLVRQEFDEEKVKIAESKLEKQTAEWLLTQEEVKKLGELASKHIGERKETMEDFQRVKMLLVDVRSELVSSRQSLVNSRERMEEREALLEKQLLELNEHKETIMSYMNSLKSAHIEVESERAKLRVVEAQNKELEVDLSSKRDLILGLQEGLDKEKASLEQAILELSSLRQELDKKNSEFEETGNFLEVKDKELVEARLEIQHLRTEQQALQLVLQERDSELVTARMRLEEVNSVVTELRILLNGKEEQVILATELLKEKEDHAQVMQHELNHAKAKAIEAKTVVKRIVDLTKDLVNSTNEDDQAVLVGDASPFPISVFGRSTADYRWGKKQLEAELELTRENLRAKETELLLAQRKLTIKDEELKMIAQKLEEKDLETKGLKETLDADDLKKLSEYGKARVNRVQELSIEKLHLEAAQLEVEAATSALQNLVEMSRHFLNQATLCIDTDLDVNVLACNEIGSESCLAENVFLGDLSEPNFNVVGNMEYLTEVKSEVARLSALTERLVQEAGAAA